VEVSEEKLFEKHQKKQKQKQKQKQKRQTTEMTQRDDMKLDHRAAPKEHDEQRKPSAGQHPQHGGSPVDGDCSGPHGPDPPHRCAECPPQPDTVVHCYPDHRLLPPAPRLHTVSPVHARRTRAESAVCRSARAARRSVRSCGTLDEMEWHRWGSRGSCSPRCREGNAAETGGSRVWRCQRGERRSLLEGERGEHEAR